MCVCVRVCECVCVRMCVCVCMRVCVLMKCICSTHSMLSNFQTLTQWMCSACPTSWNVCVCVVRFGWFCTCAQGPHFSPSDTLACEDPKLFTLVPPTRPRSFLCVWLSGTHTRNVYRNHTFRLVCAYQGPSQFAARTAYCPEMLA
jgi:hypothetical protein